MTSAYAELHCLSNFTFLRGASHPEELVETARQLGYTALALTDECSLAGVVRAHVVDREIGRGRSDRGPHQVGELDGVTAGAHHERGPAHRVLQRGV
jgi:predicted metal-dependent phosphoesterase TrpH